MRLPDIGIGVKRQCEIPEKIISAEANQLSKRSTAIAAAGCQESGFVVALVMAWSPVRRFNAG